LGVAKLARQQWQLVVAKMAAGPSAVAISLNPETDEEHRRYRFVGSQERQDSTEASIHAKTGHMIRSFVWLETDYVGMPGAVCVSCARLNAPYILRYPFGYPVWLMEYSGQTADPLGKMTYDTMRIPDAEALLSTTSRISRPLRVQPLLHT